MVFCLAVVLYGLTAQRCYSWQDSGMFQWRILHGDIAGHYGLALSHPLYIILAGWFERLPFGNSAYRLNLFSGIGMAVALANTVLLVRCLTRNVWPGMAAALLFSVMHAPWWFAGIAEVYTWHLAFFSLELLFFINLVRSPGPIKSFLLFLTAGLNLSIHNMALLALPVYAGTVFYLFVHRRLRWPAVFGTVLFYGLGASVYLYCFFNLLTQGDGLLSTISSALFGRYTGQVLNTAFSGEYFAVNAGLISLNFLSLVVPLFVAGLIYIKREAGTQVAVLLGMIALLEFGFVIRFPVPDQFSFMLPSLLMIVLAAGVGINALYRKFKGLRPILIAGLLASVLGPPVCYGLGPFLAEKAGIEIARSRERPFRNEIRYWSVPWKHNECSAERFALAALEQAAPDGVIISDDTALYPLLLVREQHNAFSDVDVRWLATLIDYRSSLAEYEDLLVSEKVYTVLPPPVFFPKNLWKLVRFSRLEGDVLYRVAWKESPGDL